MTNITQELIIEIARMDEDKQRSLLAVANYLNSHPLGVTAEEVSSLLHTFNIDPATIEAVTRILVDREPDDKVIANSLNAT